MNAVNKALTELRYTIPEDILNIGFMERNTRINQVISLDERIMSSVIRPRVLVDCNLVGGIMTKVDLNRCNIVNLADREFVVEVPKILTNGKSIVSLLSIVSNVIYSQSTAYSSMSPLSSAAMNMFNNLSTENVVQTSRLELIGDNTLIVQDPTIHLMDGILRCYIENNTNLENFNPRSYISFSKLVTLAVKSYLYNTCKVKLDQGYIYGGHELGVITEIIDSYSDAEELYQEHLNTVFRKVSFMNQSENMSRYIRSILGNTM